MTEYNRHHVLFPRVMWNAVEPAKRLRNSPLLIPSLDKQVHAALHAEVGIVPPPDFFMATKALKEFHPKRGDYLATVDELLFTFEAVTRHFNTSRMHRQLGDLIMTGIEMQRPYLREGLYVADK